MGERVLTCVYCGHEYPQGSPTWGHKVLTDHIAECEKHPMRAVILERDQLRSALIGLVGESEPDELRAMEAVIRELPVPAHDSAAILTAIRALLQPPAPSEFHVASQAYVEGLRDGADDARFLDSRRIPAQEGGDYICFDCQLDGYRKCPKRHSDHGPCKAPAAERTDG